MNDPAALERAYGFVNAAYGVTALVLIGLGAAILIDQHRRRRELAGLEASGVRRRSDKGSQ